MAPPLSDRSLHPPTPGRTRIAYALLTLVAIPAFALFLHNFAINLLPYTRLVIPPGQMKPLPGEKSFAYVFAFDGSEPDYWLTPNGWFSPRSRTLLTETDVASSSRLVLNDEVRLVGGNRWSHEPGRILFASVDNSDPRTNGRTYTLSYPILYTKKVGYTAAAIFAACVLAGYFIARRSPPPVPAENPHPRSRWRWHIAGVSALFLLGLYANTGSLAPYGTTHFGHLVKETGFIYNNDHPHFKVLYDFVNGAPRPVWEHALFLRRILFPVLAWPFTRLGGFEIGGTVASLAINVTGLVIFLFQLRRHIGERGAIFAGWLLALYPGAAYWGGLPYPYALIFPASLLMMIALMTLSTARGGRLVLISLAMGVAYLGYDLAAFFLPASLLVLLWHRRVGTAFASVALQAAPMLLWLLFLTRGLGLSLGNSNTAAYNVIVNAYLHIKDYAAWWHFVSYLPNAGLDVWFGSNFIFIPALFLIVVALNPVTSRIRLLPAEAALLLVGVGLFLFNNLAPDYYGLAWVMRGTWIARLYQPVFPALIIFAARWWQHLPALTWPRRWLIRTALVGVFAGNALVVFGPILNNPLKISEEAFYRFYNHTDLHWLYETHLRELGRRPLGFPKPQP